MTKMHQNFERQDAIEDPGKGLSNLLVAHLKRRQLHSSQTYRRLRALGVTELKDLSPLTLQDFTKVILNISLTLSSLFYSFTFFILKFTQHQPNCFKFRLLSIFIHPLPSPPLS